MSLTDPRAVAEQTIDSRPPQKRTGLASIHCNAHDKLMDRVEKVTESGCWIWNGSVTSDGYSQVRLGGKRVMTHRYMYQYFIGSIPDGLVTDHLCRVRCCVNPWHLELVTNRENTMRGIGSAAQQARQSHCLRGHLLEGDNVKVSIRGNGRKRTCLACCKIRYANRSHRLSQADKEG